MSFVFIRTECDLRTGNTGEQIHSESSEGNEESLYDGAREEEAGCRSRVASKTKTTGGNNNTVQQLRL